MRGALLIGHGGTEKLDVRDDIRVPKPGPRDVRVRVAAAGVNNTDINTRVGWYSKTAGTDDAGWSGSPIGFPRIQGADVCGYIVEVGDEVPETRVGERVLVEPCLTEANGRLLERPWYLGSECDGGFAEYVAVAARHCFKIDSAYTDVELASFPCSYSTAQNMLARASVRAGDRVLVTGASGGVGSAAVQLAVDRGASVCVVSTPAKFDAMRDLGARTAIDRIDDIVEALGRDAIDVVVDLVAGPTWPSLLDVLRPGGRYAVAGAIAGAGVELDLRTLYLKDLSLFGCTVLDAGVFGTLVERIESGSIVPLVADVYPLDQIVAAQHAFEQKRHVGKIVLSVG